MANVRRRFTTGTVVLCLVATPLSASAAADAVAISTTPVSTRVAVSLAQSPQPAPIAAALQTIAVSESAATEPNPALAFSQYGRGRHYGHHDHDAAVAAMILGAAAPITGAALLIYANRPECSTNQTAGGCGYGTKVVGGAVLTGGLVGLTIGALTWH